MGRQPRPRRSSLRTASGPEGEGAAESCFGARRLLMLPRQLPPQQRLQERSLSLSSISLSLSVSFFFLSSELAVLGLRRRDLARCGRAASPQACGTRGGARAAGRPPLPWVMPGAFPSGLQVLPEWPPRGAPRRGPLAAPARRDCRPSPQARALGGGRISSVQLLRRSTPRLAALDLHNQKLIPVEMQWVCPRFDDTFILKAVMFEGYGNDCSVQF
ncbi:uncharacterized protein LOC125160712 [Prionailurus viverrinus]|uniref:uncharacterized protein LOC122487013 n=1 Tax=Prionailurus bengalensis TaxID=37029 RepID=UPI001CA91C68|nr:uncharacterized protein LOC122487013 [Prionailurus bengalensis]XP_047705894.1 uncharacterized protein LOC125160712 [Prionailurus viverrinus]